MLVFTQAQNLNSNLAAYQVLQNADQAYAKNQPNASILYQNAEDIYKKNQHLAGQIAAKTGQTVALLKQNKLKEAFIPLRGAEELAETSPSLSIPIQTRLYFAIYQYHFLYKETNLEKEYEQKLKMLISSQSAQLEPTSAAIFYQQIAINYQAKGDWQACFDWLKLLTNWQETAISKGANVLQLAENYILMGDLKNQLNLPEESLFYYERVLGKTDFYLAENPQRVGALSMRLGRYCVRRKNYEKAEAYLNQALTYQISPIERAESQRLLAGIVLERNQINDAFVLLGEAMEIAVIKDKTSPVEQFNSCLQFAKLAVKAPANEKISLYYEHLFSNNEPSKYIKKQSLAALKHPFLPEINENLNAIYATLNLAKQTVNKLPKPMQNVANIDYLMAKGGLLFKSKNFSLARESFEQALAIMNQIYPPKHPSVVEVKRYLAEVYAEEQFFDKALVAMQEALAAATEGEVALSQPLDFAQIKFPLEFLYALGVQGTILREMQQGNYTEAVLMRSFYCFERFGELLAHIRKSHINQGSKYQLRQLSQQFCNQAVFTCYELYRITQKREFLAKAFWFSEQNKSALLLEAVQNLRARRIAQVEESIIQQDDSLRAEMAFLQAEILEELKNGVKNPNPKLTELENKLKIVQTAHELLIQNIEKSHPKYFELKYTQKYATIESLQQKLTPKELFLSYSVLNDSTILLLAISATEAKMYLQKSPESINKSCQRLIDGIIAQSYPQYMLYAHQLYQLLWQPAAEMAEKYQTVYICREAALNLIPFEVLSMEKKEQKQVDYTLVPFLLQKFDISYQPSVTLFILPRIIERNSQAFAGFSPVFGRDSSSLQAKTLEKQFKFWQLAPLEGAQKEVAAISKLFSVYPYADSVATETQLKAIWKNTAVLHIATHGLMNDKNPLLSCLAFSEEKNNDGLLHVYELYAEEINAELVVLSACNTGTGELEAGEGSINTARAFEVAGCSNTVMSLWAVSDQATEVLMQLFYQYLRQGEGKSTALRLAKLDLIKNYKGQIAAPYYWAAFCLNGDNLPVEKLKSTYWWLWLLAAGLSLLVGLYFYFRAKK